MPQRWEQMAAVKECATAAKHGTSAQWSTACTLPSRCVLWATKDRPRSTLLCLHVSWAAQAFPETPVLSPLPESSAGLLPYVHLSLVSLLMSAPYTQILSFFLFHTHWRTKMSLNCHFSWSWWFFGCNSCCSYLVLPFICLSLLPEHRCRHPSEVTSVSPTVSSDCGK